MTLADNTVASAFIQRSTGKARACIPNASLPLTDAPKAYETFQKKQAGMVKVLLKP